VKVPLLDLRAQHASIAEEIEAAALRVVRSGQFILGEEVESFEREIARQVGLTHAIGMSSGTDALLAALWALGVGPGDEVITTAMSFFATAGAIVRLGAKPVFADIDEHFNLDPDSALARVTARTRAIIPVHLFGRPAEVAPLASAGLPIVEDAAQALGVPNLGKIARIVTLSFFPSKNLGAAGDAGMTLTNDAELADRLRLLRAHGSRPKYTHHIIGGNFRLDALQAAILRAKRPHLAKWNAHRRENVARYRELLANTPLTLPEDVEGHIWHHFVVRAPRRDELRAHLSSREIETEVYYPRPLHQQPCLHDESSLPNAERAAKEVLALPVHPELSEAQLEHVATSIKEFYGS
jgi:dTDP-4-amino-4,6-dideoxygalactose transaminase